MSFHPSLRPAYEQGIALAIGDTGYEPLRLDDTHHTEKIDDAIIVAIKASRFLIADFTCKIADASGDATQLPLGNVYYEAGFAHGIGLKVIFSCRSDCLDQVRFDIRQYPYIDWQDHGDLRMRLRARIAATIGERSGESGVGLPGPST